MLYRIPAIPGLSYGFRRWFLTVQNMRIFPDSFDSAVKVCKNFLKTTLPVRLAHYG